MHRLAIWFYEFFVHPFLMMYPDGTMGGSMPAWMAFGIIVAMIERLAPYRSADGHLVVAPIGWPDAFIVLFAFLGVPLYEAAVSLARSNPQALLHEVLERFGVGEVSVGAAGTTGPANDGAPGGDLY